MSGAEIIHRLDSAGYRPEGLEAILVSHEHSDHIQGVGVLARRYRLPVYLTEGALAAGSSRLGPLPERSTFKPGREFQVGEITVRPFSIPHDAADPVAFTLSHRGVKVGVATDMGFTTALSVQHLSACHLLVLEANHDSEMLASGPYPWELKQRIRGKRGHLSNAEAGKLLERVLHDDLEGVVLAHLSETNNRPDLASRTAAAVLQRYRMCGKVSLAVARPDKVVSMAPNRPGRAESRMVSQ